MAGVPNVLGAVEGTFIRRIVLPCEAKVFGTVYKSSEHV